MSTHRQYSFLDRCVIQLDQGLHTMFGKPTSQRPNPADSVPECRLSTSENQKSGCLMRVNHTGEVSAQALYQAQALTARTKTLRYSMQQSAREENDHLTWCEARLSELGTHASYLNPFWYVSSFALGLLVGLIGDAWNLGFVAETERQVVNHLNEHLQQLPVIDKKSKSILEQMKEDEAYHASVAMTAGAAELPGVIKKVMKYLSKVMTKTAYWI
jgi:3-demethoxyubiquinol 3-hydroxylase